MGSRTARLVSVEGSLTKVSPSGDTIHTVYGSFTFESGGRTYRVPFRARLQPRNPHTRERSCVLVHGLPGEDARVQLSDGGRKPKLSSLAVDYDLTPYVVEGGALPVPRPERACAEDSERRAAALHAQGPRDADSSGSEEVIAADLAPAPASNGRGGGVDGDEVTALSTLSFDGDVLEVVQIEGLGWVSLPSLLRPFGKRVDAAAGLLSGWARTRMEWLAHPSRTGVQNARSMTTLLHIEDAPLLIARLDGRGMSPEMKAKHARYLRHVAGVLAEHFGLRPAAPPPVAPIDPWAAIRAIAGGAVELQGRVAQVEGQVSTAARAALDATRLAEEAKTIAEQARTMAGAANVVAEVQRVTPPGGSGATPDGAWSARLPDGFKSQRALARDFALPSDGVGSGFVGRVARAIGVYDDPSAVATQDVVIGGRARREHVVYGPTAVDRMAPALRAAHATMVARGYTVRHGVMCPATVGPAKRSKTFVLEEMFEAAVSDRVAPISTQTSIPGVDDARKAG